MWVSPSIEGENCMGFLVSSRLTLVLCLIPGGRQQGLGRAVVAKRGLPKKVEIAFKRSAPETVGDMKSIRNKRVHCI